MSALGQKQTSDCRRLMSALPPIADIVQHGGYVFVPKVDIQSAFPSALTLVFTNLQTL
jgi:hypothetical protein